MKNIKKNKLMFLGLTIVTIVSLFIGMNAQAVADTISSNLHVGSRGSDVRKLQTLLAQDSEIYPSGVVSGYFGNLTKAAVFQYQIAANIAADGVVGPQTRSSLNSHITSGNMLDVTGPTLFNDTIQATSNSATVTWTTNENATGVVYYSSVPLTGSDIDTPPGYVIYGSVANDSNNGTVHTVLIPNLSSHTTYYYHIVSTDTYGNPTVTLKSTFTTN